MASPSQHQEPSAHGPLIAAAIGLLSTLIGLGGKIWGQAHEQAKQAVPEMELFRMLEQRMDIIERSAAQDREQTSREIADLRQLVLRLLDALGQ